MVIFFSFRRVIHFFLILLAFGCATSEIQARLLRAGDASAFDMLGSSIALDGNTAIVGAPNRNEPWTNSGAAYVFGLDSNGVWSEQAKLTTMTAKAHDRFGFSVAVSGNLAVVGAPGADDAGDSSGAAYIFSRDANGNWSEQARLTASDASYLASFGDSVAISGTTVVIGARSAITNQQVTGAAYVFVYDGVNWNEQARLTASDGAEWDNFGRSVALAGDTVAIGATGASANGFASGAVYVYVRTGSTWNEQAKLVAGAGATGDLFGNSVALSGDDLLVGSKHDDTGGTNAGAAYVFTRTSGVWSEQAKLTATGGAADDYFGASVAIVGNTAVIGAYNVAGAGTARGLTYVFERAGNSWSQVYTRQPSSSVDNRRFGSSVAASTSAIVVGENGYGYNPKQESGALYDFPPNSPDLDGDGLSNIDEANLYGTDATRADTDGDGLQDGEELNTYGTDPNNPDTDGDTLPDAWEVNNGTDALVADATADPDGDGLDNAAEFAAGTSPISADTDSDGLTDPDEINLYQTNPALADTDRDNLTDYEEIIVFGTDPLVKLDTDMDGMSDDWEQVRGTLSDTDDALVDNDGDGYENILEYFKKSLPLDSSSVPVIKTWYVDASSTTGIEDGTAANPYLSLQVAIDAAQSGDTISLASGSYSIGLVYEKSLQFTGPADRSVSISSSSFFVMGRIQWGGFTNIDLGTTTGPMYFFQSRNMVFDHCKLAPGAYVYIYSNSSISIKNSLLENPGSSTEAIRLDNSHIDLVNDTIAGFPVGLNFTGTSGTANIRNTILANVDDFAGTPANISISYSLISDGEYAGSNGNLSGSAQFVDIANGDFHLQAVSLAIDSGDPADAYDIEPANNGGRINMGAYGNTAEASVGQDTDGDGLTDQNERCFDGDCGSYNPYDPATNPTGTDLDIALADTDGDGISDSAEVTAGTSPVDPADPGSQTVLGDINGDGQVNAADILLVQRAAMEGPSILTAEQFQRGDVAPLIGGTPAPDGVINLGDVLVIQRKAMGQINF